MFRPNFRAIFRLIFEKVECTIVHSTCSNISLKMALQLYSCTFHLFKDQPGDGPTIVHSTCQKISLKMALQLYNCTLHLFKDQPEDGPTIVQLYTLSVQRSA